MAATGGGHAAGNGTSYAAPYVSATAALLLERFPGLSPAEVTRRLTATADPAPGGSRSDDYGFGLLNPYRALTETLGPRSRRRRRRWWNLADDPSAVALRERRRDVPGHRADRGGHRPGCGGAARVGRGGAAPGPPPRWQPAGRGLETMAR